MELSNKVSNEKLYLSVVGSCLPRCTETVIFLCQYCGCESFDVNFVQMTTETADRAMNESKSSTVNREIHLGDNYSGITKVLHPRCTTPTSGQCSDEEMSILQARLSKLDFGVKWCGDVTWLVRQCQLPAVIKPDQQKTCYSGLGAVLRRIIQTAHSQRPQENLDTLLGFKQACLKKCAEVSSWTKLCEIDIYKQDVSQSTGSIPAAILEFESRLSTPVVLSSKMKGKKNHQRHSAHHSVETKPRNGETNSTRLESVFRTNTSSFVDKRKVKKAKYKNSSLQNLGSNSECPSPKEDTCSNVISLTTVATAGDMKTCATASSDLPEPTSMSPNQISTTNKNKTCANQTDTAPVSGGTFQRLFAEGPYVTLSDFALFCSVHAFVESSSDHRDLLLQIPLVLRWYVRMWSVPNIRECASKCGMQEVVLTDVTVTLGGCLVNETVRKATEVIKHAHPVTKPKTCLSDILHCLEQCPIDIKVADFVCDCIQLPWDTFPEEVNPSKDVSDERARCKREQIETLVAAVRNLAKPGDVVVDFCSGGGHVGIVLAHCLPDCHVVLVENNEETVKRAEARLQVTRLTNISIYQCNLGYFIGQFDIGVSLHACGVATDLVIEKCLSKNASFVCSPCCYGSARDSHLIKYPRSSSFRASTLTYEDYLHVGHLAEQTSRNFKSEMARQAKFCMSVIDTDRAEAAREKSYVVNLYTLIPSTCSPKNNLLVGRPPSGTPG